MEKQFWNDRWETNQIGFHQPQVHSYLLKFFSQIVPGKIMVPLCGKSLDLLWLLKQGHEVVGCELSPIACKAFFEENHIPYQIKAEGEFTIYTSNQTTPGITLWCGDFFQLPRSAWADCTGLYDRAAMVALPPDLREKYADAVLKNTSRDLKAPFQILLVTVDYECPEFTPPPHSVNEKEVHNRYGSQFSIQALISEPEVELSSRMGLDQHAITQKAYWLKKLTK